MSLRTLSTLQLALGLSLAVHAIVLSVRFIDPQAVDRMFRDTPLEVVLVNARTADRPTKAHAIAQADMAGGGEPGAVGRSTSPAPYARQDVGGDSPEELAQKKVQNLLREQTMMLTQIRRQIAALPQSDPTQPSEAPEQVAREEKRKQLVKLLAEIEQRINRENERPRRRYIGPSTREKAYAVYYDRLRRTIEDKGTENFPEADGRKLYGELTMMITVNHDGRLLTTEVVQGSGNALLDRRAEAIARSAAPFGRFNKAMLEQADQIVVVSRFRFTRDETLETRVSAPTR